MDWKTSKSLFRSVGIKGGLVDRVVDEIQRVIVNGHLELGMKLPPERELAEELGVSRTVIREAVRILVAKGLLETKPGVGTIVRQVTRDQIVGPLSLLLQAQEGGFSIEHLHQVRHILEIEIAGLAALQATQEDVAELERIVADMELVTDMPEVFVAKDADFHHGLAGMTHNPLLIVLLDSIRDLMQEVRLLVTRHPGLHRQVMHDHHEILRRVAARDVEGARQAMQGHLEHAREIQHAVLNHDAPSSPSRRPPVGRDDKDGARREANPRNDAGAGDERRKDEGRKTGGDEGRKTPAPPQVRAKDESNPSSLVLGPSSPPVLGPSSP